MNELNTDWWAMDELHTSSLSERHSPSYSQFLSLAICHLYPEFSAYQSCKADVMHCKSQMLVWRTCQADMLLAETPPPIEPATITDLRLSATNWISDNVSDGSLTTEDEGAAADEDAESVEADRTELGEAL